ncbi:MAG TPA: DNA mismatch repair endonuclease MutL [Phycisphaerae bacterium]|nr:DNA mismatch repair endonuclease MutL [Phycisphaerae bacterium]
MPPISVLPETVVNQIAAGEIIERPASAVKELLENAIDAQAARIIVELEAAGKKLIRVSDDGVGIPAAEVSLALASHATSKIASADDLAGVTTLGFRGEALPSIASVADVRLVSRTHDTLEATEVAVSGGKAGAAVPTSGPVGTTVEVRNLFRYVPARRKFLKTDATEMGHVTEQVARVAIAYPRVHLTVLHNGRSVYELPPTDSVRDRIGAFFGADLAQALIEVGSEEPAGSLRGLVGPPNVVRATTKMQYLFLNGRYIRDRSLLHALREAYRGMLEGNRQPVAFLFLTVPPDRVDANVHPTKIEVRLRDAHLLYGQLLAVVREKLLGPGLAPHLAPFPPAPVSEASPDSEGGHEARVREAVADFLRSPPPRAQSRLDLKGRSAAKGAGAPAAPLRPHEPRYTSGRPGFYREASPRQETEAPPQAHAIQLHNTYLVAETSDGILIVDQHALHERVLFDRIMTRLEAGPLEGQRLLVPVTLDVTDGEMAALEAHRQALGQLGIEAEPLGPRSVGIHSFPALLEKADPAGTVRDFLAWAVECESPPAARQVLEKLAHVAACRGAVKAGDRLSPEEIEALLAHREAAEMAATCPHGRPTAVILRKADLERQFGRDYATPPATSGNEPLPF